MSLTLGIGPLSRRPAAGQLNGTIEGPAHLLWLHEVPKRVRAVVAGETVVDTVDGRLLHETRLLPTYYLPRADVRWDLLEPTDLSTHCPFKGDARYWSIRVGDRVAENAVWGYDEPLPGAPDLAPYVAFYWDRVDHWYEEDEEVFAHARDPFHRVDIRRSDTLVRVVAGDEVLAESARPQALFETGLPVRWYLPADDVRLDRLTASTTLARCPYKGQARYWSLDGADDVAWWYPDPLLDARPVAGMLCFDDTKVDLQVTRR